MTMTPLRRRGTVVYVFVIAAWLLVSLIQSHEASAERKKVSGTTGAWREQSRPATRRRHRRCCHDYFSYRKFNPACSWEALLGDIPT